MTKPVSIGDNSWLQCPDCEEYYLHQLKVTTTFRDSEDDDGTCVEITEKECKITRQKDSEIEGRRDVIYIEFSCECCGDNKKNKILMIKQHKGNTVMEWKP